MRTIETERLVDKDEEQFSFSVVRTPKELRLFVKSQPIRDFFANLAKDQDAITVPEWNAKCFSLKPKDLPTVPDSDFTHLGGPLFISDGGIVNLGFLRAVNLDEGVTFRLQGLFHKPTVRSFENAFIDATNQFIEDRIAEYRSSFVITTRKVIEDGDVIRVRKP